jgi:cold shock CspA family protein
MEANDSQVQAAKYTGPHGIIKQWNSERNFGIIYAPEGKRYFLHISKVIDGVPELYRRVIFDIGAARRPEELPQALNVRVGAAVGSSK